MRRGRRIAVLKEYDNSIVNNRYQSAVPEQHWETATLFLFYTLTSFSAFSFCVCHSITPTSCLVAFIVCGNSL